MVARLIPGLYLQIGFFVVEPLKIMTVQIEARKYEFSSYFVVPVRMLFRKEWTAMFVASGLTSKL